MKFLKVVANSMVNGLFFSTLLALLVFNLNINLPFRISTLAGLTIFLMLSYGLLVTFLSLLIFLVFHFFFGKEYKTGFLSPSFLTISFSLLLLIFLLVFRENYIYFLSFFESRIRSLLTAQMVALFVLSVAGFFVHYGFRRQKKACLFSSAYFILFAFLLAFAFFQRANYPPPQNRVRPASIEIIKIEKKIFILGLEGLSFDFIIPLSSEGKLSNFSWLMEGGCWGRFKSFSPNDLYTLNTSFNTGKLPAQHRQISNIKYTLPAIKERIEVVPRFLLFRQLTRTGLLRIMPNEPYLPPQDIWKIIAENQTTVLKRDWQEEQEAVNPSQKTITLFNLLFKDFQQDSSPLFMRVKQAFFRDYEYEEKAFQEKNGFQPQLFYLFLDGLNTVESYFYKYSFPDYFGAIKQDEINRYSPVIERYYQFYDQIIGKYLASLKEDELFMVFSPHGIEPLPLWKRFVERMLGNADVSASHEQAPDGAIFFYGKGISKGKNIEGMKLVDVAPTLLYYLGLPVGKDMDGIVQGPLFTPEFTAENPIFYILSYENARIKNLK